MQIFFNFGTDEVCGFVLREKRMKKEKEREREYK